MQRLKEHFEKQKQEASSGRAPEGTTTVGQMSGLSKETLSGGNHVQRSYAKAVVGEKGKDGDSGIQIAGGVVPKQFLEGAGDKGITAGQLKIGLERARFTTTISGDHVQHQKEILAPQHIGVDLQGLKTILVALQSKIASCLQKLEMGWDKKGKGPGENGLKHGENKEAGPGLNQSRMMKETKPAWKQPIINYYHKTYVRRRPRRQLYWRPKTMGQKEQQVAGDSPEAGRISSSGKLNVTDQAEIMDQTNE